MPLSPEAAEKLRKKYADMTKDEQGQQYVNLKNDQAIILRVLPAVGMGDDDVEFWRTVGRHFNLGPNGDQMLWCPRICSQLSCPVCDMQKALEEGDEDERALASGCWPSITYLFNAVLLAGPHQIGKQVPMSEFSILGVKLWHGHKAERDVLTKASLDPDGEPVWDLKKGNPVEISRDDTQRPIYQVYVKSKPYPLDETVLKERHDFEDIIELQPEEFIRELLDNTTLKPSKFYRPRKSKKTA